MPPGQAEAPNSEQLSLPIDQTPTRTPCPTTTTTANPIKLTKTEASHLKINTSKIQAETIDQNLLSPLTATAPGQPKHPILESHYLQKKLIPQQGHKQGRNPRRLAKGETPPSVPAPVPAPGERYNTPTETALRAARDTGSSASHRTEMEVRHPPGRSWRARSFHLCTRRTEAPSTG